MKTLSNESGRVLLFELLSGSDLYGTRTKDSDTDTRGVVFPTKQELLGLKRFEQQEDKVEDKVYYAVGKFVHLLLKGNPNVQDWLWASGDAYTYRSPAGDRLINSARLFLSDRIGKAILGYLDDQTKRMVHLGHAKNMGEKRRKLVEEFGFDTKNASHAYRLAIVGFRLYTEGIVVPRLDADTVQTVLDIKQGKYTLGEVVDLVSKAKEELLAVREENVAKVPKNPDHDAAEELLIRLQSEHLGECL
jgi:predicted nucleotidyltransferase